MPPRIESPRPARGESKMKMKPKVLGFFRSAARACLPPFLGLVIIGVQPAAAATTWYVTGSTGSDTNDCMSAATACKTIQAAVNKASSGNTIMVATGLYSESVNVDRGLLIDGPNVGISPNGGSRVLEAVIDGGGGTAIRISTTEPVTIDGFTFSGGTGALIDSYTSGNNPTIKDRKSTRLNSSHSQISYAVFCLKKKKKEKHLSSIDAAG